MKILIASNNKHKIKEISDILNLSIFPEIKFITPKEISSENFEVEENGNTFFENAKIKALAYYEHFGIPTLCDDSGLNVDLLGGAPGVFSARFSSENATDQTNRLKLQKEISELGYSDSNAHFTCSICFWDGQTLLSSEGICSGKIVLEERGENGFGYDPMFIPDGYDITFAELSEVIKNKISHRANALSKFLPIFAEYYKKQNLKTK